MDECRQVFESIFGDEPVHHSPWTRGLIAGAAGLAAMKSYEDHVRRTGERLSHVRMKEFETRGLDFLDREKAKRHTIHQAHKLAEEAYVELAVFVVKMF